MGGAKQDLTSSKAFDGRERETRREIRLLLKAGQQHLYSLPVRFTHSWEKWRYSRAVIAHIM